MSLALSTGQTLKYALGGWFFFVFENVVLSHNRSYLINDVLKGDEELYHVLYGGCSTAAVGMIAYGYKKVRGAAPLYKGTVGRSRHAGAFLLQAFGLIGLSQIAPKLQLPVTLQSEPQADVSGAAARASAIAPQPALSPLSSIKVRCPIDFKHGNSDDSFHGFSRITRHQSLWSLSSLSLGSALVTLSVPQSLALGLGPLLVALVGGSHQDYRFRRGLGGTLPPDVDRRTSNVPFVAMLSGEQENEAPGGFTAFRKLWEETKGVNAAAAVAMAAAVALKRVR